MTRFGRVTPVRQSPEAERRARRGAVHFERRVDGTLAITVDAWHHVTHRRGTVGGNGGFPQRLTHTAPLDPVAFDPPPGPVNRARITAALDLAMAHGPEVDEALGVAEPTVDRWEDGTLIPTAADVGRLAALTGMIPAWFYKGPLPDMSQVFFCHAGDGLDEDPGLYDGEGER